MSPLLLLAAVVGLSSAKTVTYDFDIGWVSAAPDGYTRPVIGINGQWPIPIIEANANDDIVVNVHNSLGNESTSLHFHGLWQQQTASYDGPVGVTQCPIEPGQSFTYTFKAYPAGTHWYHSHDKGQYPDGLRGKMIIHDPDWESSLNIDEQIYLSMSDWYHTQMPYLIHDYLSPDNTVGNLPSPDSFLFNDTRTAPKLKFKPNKRYLLRIVSTSALACGQFHINSHKLTVVAIDGVEVNPQDTDTIIICAGQSYDVVVVGQSNPLKSVQYIVKMTTDMLTHDIPADSAITIVGDVVYSVLGITLGLLAGILSPSWTAQVVLDDFTLKPLDGQKLLGPPTNEVYLETNQTYYAGIGSRIKIGSQPWTEPKVPSLYTALSTGDQALVSSTYGPGVDPFILKSNDIVQIHMQNPQAFPHPMHLHGHVFQVVARGTGTWNGDESSLPAIPMKRDNAVIPAGGYLVLRFKADNPGVWFFHCHIDWHLVGGMASTFIEAPDVLQQQQSIPAAGTAICAAAGECSKGNCNCQDGAISASDAEQQCNTIFNSKNMDYGALISN